MNAYERRRKLELARADLKADQLAYERAVEQDRLMQAYEEAHLAIMGYEPKVYYKNGYYHVEGQIIRALRRKDLIKETQKLQALAHEQEIQNA